MSQQTQFAQGTDSHPARTADSQRKWPRMVLDETGIVRLGSASRGPSRDCVLRDISPEGMRLSIPVDKRTRQLLYTGSTLFLQFQVHGFEFELPCSVVWRTRSNFQGPPQVGVRLRLEIAGKEMRSNYRRWVRWVMSRAGAQ